MSRTRPPGLPLDLARALTAAESRLGVFRGRLRHLAEVTSTNDVLAELAREGEPEGCAVTADLQTAGRGRLGRSWFSPPGSGLYTSVLLRPPTWPVGERPGARSQAIGLVTLATGIALAEALRAIAGAPVELKWPNDLMVAGTGGRPWRKLGGILAEAAGEADAVSTIVVGFGLNVRRTAYPEELGDIAIALEECGAGRGRWDVLVGVLAELAGRLHDLRLGRTGSVVERFRRLSPSSAGAAVAWVTGTTRRQGTTAGVDEDGALLVRTPDGVERMVGGELEWHV